MGKILLFLGVMAIPLASGPRPGALPEILMLGTYHMANPGHDTHNMPADDVLSSKRQQEMVQLIEVLRKFHPTKIAIEATVGSKRVQQEYTEPPSRWAGPTSRATRPRSSSATSGPTPTPGTVSRCCLTGSTTGRWRFVGKTADGRRKKLVALSAAKG